MLGHLVSTQRYAEAQPHRAPFSWVWRLIAFFFKH